MPVIPIDPRARFEQLLADFGGKVRSLVRLHCQRDQGLDIDDIEQEVRIRLWHALERDRSAAFHASYIQRVVVTTVIDALRRAQVRATEPMPEDEQELSAAFVVQLGPDGSASSDEQMAALLRCLNELPERRRRPLELHLQGFQQAEIATLVGGTAEAVRKLISRGLEDLKLRLRELGMGEFDD